MTVPANVVAYFGEPAWGLRFGVVDVLHPGGHRGLDLVHDAGSPIPALRAGLVVNVQFSSIIGTVVVIQVSDTDFDGYAHTRNVQVKQGDRVVQGQQLAEVAGYGDAHGSAWAGPHTHLTNGPNGTSIFDGTVRDPANVITATLTAAAAESITTLTDLEPDMPTPIAATDSGTYNGFSAQAGSWALISGSAFIVAQSAEDVAAWANLLTPDGNVNAITSKTSTITRFMTGRSFAILQSQFAKR